MDFQPPRLCLYSENGSGSEFKKLRLVLAHDEEHVPTDDHILAQQMLLRSKSLQRLGMHAKFEEGHILRG